MYKLSIVIPLLNEAESLPELHSWLYDVVTKNNLSYELILIDDGSTDTSWNIIEELALKDKNIKALKFQKNYGKSAAFQKGFELATGQVVITMDADLQDSPEEIPELYRMIVEDNFDLVSGWKKKRFDSIIFKNFPSKIFNWAARKTSGIKLNDFK